MKKFVSTTSFLLLCFCCAMPGKLWSQTEPCGSDAVMQLQFQQNPNYQSLLEQYDLSYSQNPNQGEGPSDGTYEIPTVFHIIHNNGAENISDAQVLAAITQANDQLAGGEGGWDTKIQLVLARIDPNGNCTNGINRVQYPVPDADKSNLATDIAIKNLSRWDPSKYLNVWIVRCILPDSDCSNNVGTAGYSYVIVPDPLVDGIVIAHRYLGETGTASGNTINTLAHEFGHYASLYHVWGQFSNTTLCDENCHAPNEGLEKGDRVEDTNPCIYSGVGVGCAPYLGQCAQFNCTNGYPDLPYPKENYMSYAWDCQDRFTEGQATRMYMCLDNIRANLWSDENQRCTGVAGYYGENIVINSPSAPSNWTTSNLPNNGNILIKGNLTIEGGSTLTISSGVVVRFCGNGRLIIKPNGRLNLYGKLTNSCGAPWKGVEVWGNSSQSQYSMSGVNGQGRLVGYTGSVIENADIGVQLWGPDYFANAGGLISCNGVTFRNSRRAVEFAPYNNFWPFQVGPTGQSQNYAASFGRCIFVTDDGYPNPTHFEAFLYMKGVRGVSITGSTFTNAQTAMAGSILGYGYGIYASDAGFSVQSACNGTTYPCTNYTHSQFTNLGYGIYTANVVGNQPFNVQRARFNDCYFGIYNKAISQGTLLFNVFNLGNVPNAALIQGQEYAQFGAFYEGGMSGFTYQENTFQKITGNVANTVGSYSKDLGYFDGNVLRRNTYNGVKFGNIAELINGYDPGGTYSRGLHYLCNTNTGVTSMDFSVLFFGTRIRKDQGLLVDPAGPLYTAAGNKFSQIATDFQNLGFVGVTYYKNPAVPSEDPIVVGGNFSEVPANPNTCPSDYCDPPCKTPAMLVPIKSDFFVKRGEYNAAKTAYDAAVANGNTALAGQKSHEMAFARHAMDEASFMVTLHLLYDTTNFYQDSLRAWLARMDNPAAQLQLARNYLAIGQPNQAATVLSQAATLFGLDSEDATDFSNLSNIISLIGNQSVYSLNAQTLSALDGYANGNGLEAAVLAQNIKSMYGSYYPPRYQLPEGGGERSSEGNVQSNIVSDLAITPAPNPSSGDVVFAITGTALEGKEMALNITDVNGKLVWSRRFTLEGSNVNTIWSTASAPNGIYVYRLATQDGQNNLAGKIILRK